MPNFRSTVATLAALLVSACATVPNAVDREPGLQLAQSITAPPATITPPAAAAPAKPAETPRAASSAATGERQGTSATPLADLRDDVPQLPTIDLTVPPDDLWTRLRNGFGMPDLHSPLVADRQAYYLNRPEMLKRILQRSRRYLHHVVEELERRGMPTELALLPMVESAYNPLAYSPARALGMWQFIPSTGKNYKLDQNWWLDERRDVIASTSAALDYLQNIYEMHGDWHLALASYNWGEHAVARAVAKNEAKGLPTDYLSLTMPGETRYYVPKLQALKNILAQPDLFGFQVDAIPNEPYFETVDIPGDMDIALAAKLAEVPLDEFIALNPAYHRPLIRSDGDAQLVLPIDKVQTFQTNLQRYEAEDKPLATWRTYGLKKGEKLEAVASRFGLDPSRLRRINGITPRSKIGPGFSLLVPGPGAYLPEQLAARLPSLPAEPKRAAKGGKKRGTAKAVAKGKTKAVARKPAGGKRRR
jgi:membrane-bound lytic murein transglycosylase D